MTVTFTIEPEGADREAVFDYMTGGKPTILAILAISGIMPQVVIFGRPISVIWVICVLFFGSRFIPILPDLWFLARIICAFLYACQNGCTIFRKRLKMRYLS